jgi:acyl carrier protein
MARTRKDKRAEYFSSLTLAEGLEIFGQILQVLPAQITVLPLHWRELFDRFPKGQVPILLADMGESQNMSDRHVEYQELQKRLNEAPPGERRKLLLLQVQSLAARILGVDRPSSLDIYRPLNDLGFDSLMAIELRNSLSAIAGRSLPPTLLFEYPTIESLNAYLAQELIDDLGVDSNKAKLSFKDMKIDSFIEQLERLQDDDVNRLLEGIADDRKG